MFVILSYALAAGQPARAQSSLCQQASPPTYYYDAGGRLTGVLGPGAATAAYTYDMAGNIAAVTRNPALAVFQVCPSGAPAGQIVTIFGAGFPTTGSPPSVSFNGTAGQSVTVQSANQLTVTVPSGASTGPVSVTAGSTQANTQSQFVVGGSAPQITGVTSAAGTLDGFLKANPFPFYGAGTAQAGTGYIPNTQTLTIQGLNFDITPPLTVPLLNTRNKVYVGTRAAQIQSINGSGTSMTVAVPIGGSVLAGGPVAPVLVETPAGSATFSSSSLLIAPAAVTPSSLGGSSAIDIHLIDSVGTATISPTATTTLSFAGTNHYVAAVFQGTAGSMVSGSVTLSLGNSPPPQVLLIGPDGSPVNIATIGGVTTYPQNSNPLRSIQFWQLPQNGTYTIFAENTFSSGITATATIAIQPVPTPITLNPGSYYVPGPAGTPTIINTGNLAAGGGAIFYFQPSDNNPVSLTTTLGSALQSPFMVTVTAPDGFTQVYNNTNIRSDALIGTVPVGTIDFSGPLTVAAGQGLYTVNFQPLSYVAGSATFSLVEVPTVTPTQGTWPTRGVNSYTLTVSDPGQAATLNLPQGALPANINTLESYVQGAGINAYCFSVSMTDTGLNQQLYRALQCGGGNYSAPLTLPTASQGPYTIQTYSLGATATGTVTFMLWDAAAISQQPITVGGSAVTTDFVAPGPNGALTFSGTAGEVIKISTAIPSGWGQQQCLTVALANPSAPPYSMASYYQCPGNSSGGAYTLDSIVLPTSGSYTINLTPSGGGTGNVQTSLSPGTPPGSNVLPIGVPLTQPMATQNMPATLTYTPVFTTSSSTSPAYVNLISAPSYSGTLPTSPPSPCFGDTLTGGATYTSGNSLSCTAVDGSGPQALPLSVMSGQATFTSYITNSGTFSQTLYNFPTPSAAANIATLPGVVTVPVTPPGQVTQVTFSGTQGKFVKIYLGLDQNLQLSCDTITVTELSGPIFPILLTDTVCAGNLGYTTGALYLPATTSYSIAVKSAGIPYQGGGAIVAGGNITIGVSGT